jgi:hypothetical protein
MDSIYAGAYVTLAALSAFSASGGCFSKTTSHCSSIDRTWWDKSELHGVLVHERFRHMDPESRDMPLTQRAWAFQERLLSTRVIHFAPDEVLWECMESIGCECSKLNKRRPIKHERSWIRRTGSPCVEGLAPYDSENWHTVVSEYTGRHLTYETDIFPALQVIAKQLSARKSATYLAGLWEETLPKDLLWAVRDTAISVRPKKWRAPSWSWASVLGTVQWEPSSARSAVTILACETTSAGEDKLGEISGGYLRLKGRCVAATLSQVLKDGGEDENYCATFWLILKLSPPLHALPLLCHADYNLDPSAQHRRTKGTACLERLSHDVKSDDIERPSFEAHIPVPGYDDVLLIEVARCGFYRTKSFFLVLHCISEAKQKYERFGIATSPWTGSTYHDYDTIPGSQEREITIL